MRIQQRLEHSRDQHDQVQTQFQKWQEQWKSQQKTLGRQLEKIESLLGHLVPAADDTPRLAIVSRE